MSPNNHLSIIDAIIANPKLAHVLLGVPGAGKTELLVQLILRLRRDYPLDRILFLGFACNTVAEFRSRIGVDALLEAQTIHSFGYWQLIELTGATIDTTAYPELGYRGPLPVRNVIRVLDGEEAIINSLADLASDAGIKISGRPPTRSQLEQIYRVYCQRMLRGLEEDPSIGSSSPLEVAANSLLPLYADRKQARPAIDFFDMLALPLAHLRSNPAYRARLGSRFSWLIADEGQDLSPMAWELIGRIRGPNTGLVVAGDVLQRIYPFLEALPNFVGATIKRYLSAHTQVHALTINRRSTQAITRFVAAIAQQFRSIHKAIPVPDLSKPEGDRPWLVGAETVTDGIGFVAAKINELVLGGWGYGDFAILLRAPNAGFNRGEVEELVSALKSANIPVKLLTNQKVENERIKVMMPQQAEEWLGVEEVIGDRVLVSSVHSLKGGQRRCIFVLGVSSSSFPLRNPGFSTNLEEERSVFYVAGSRAQEQLYLVHHHHGGDLQYLSDYLRPILDAQLIQKIQAPSSRKRWFRHPVPKLRPLVGQDLL